MGCLKRRLFSLCFVAGEASGLHCLSLTLWPGLHALCSQLQQQTRGTRKGYYIQVVTPAPIVFNVRLIRPCIIIVFSCHFSVISAYFSSFFILICSQSLHSSICTFLYISFSPPFPLSISPFLHLPHSPPLPLSIFPLLLLSCSLLQMFSEQAVCLYDNCWSLGWLICQPGAAQEGEAEMPPPLPAPLPPLHPPLSLPHSLKPATFCPSLHFSPSNPLLIELQRL